MATGSKPNEWTTYKGVRMIVKRRFTYKGIAKVELYNPFTEQMFVVNENEIL